MSGQEKPFEMRVPSGAVPHTEQVLADAGMAELVDVVADDSVTPSAIAVEGTVVGDDPDD